MPTTTGTATSFIDFTRASNATVTDSDGKVKWAPHNLLLASESFDAASWTKTTVTPTANSIAAPNGTTTADTLAASGANGTALQTFTAEAISYTFGVWLKRKTGTGNIQIAADSGTYTTVTITSDWALYTISQTPTAGSKTAGIRIVTSGDEVYAWGAHLYRSDLGGMQPNTSSFPMYNPTTPKNLLGYTEAFGSWTGSSATVNPNVTLSPNGLQTADLMYPTTTGTFRGVYQSASGKTVSVYAKAAGKSYLAFVTANGAGLAAWFNLTTGVKGTVIAGYEHDMVDMGDGWYRCWMRSTSGVTLTISQCCVTDADNSNSVTANGTDGIYLWGAQLSDSASLDPYVPVYGAAVTSAAYYGPRRDFDPVTLACKGLLVEEQRANLLLYSAQFDVSANWVPAAGVSVSANTTISPDGTLTADTLTSSGNQLDQSVSCSTNTVYTNSLYFKKTSGAAYQPGQYLLFSGGTFVIYAVRLNTDTGVATAVSAGGFTAPSSFAVQDAGQYWRLSITGNSNNNTTASLRLYANLSAGGGAGAGSQIIWGAQLELGSFATSYIPTGAATATRNADVASVSTQAFPYSATEGTVVVNYDRVGINQYSRLFTLGDIGNNQVSVLHFNAGQENPYYVTSGAATTVTGPSIPAANATSKMGLAFKTGDSAYSLNGATATAVTTSFTLSATGLQLGHVTGSGQYLNGHIRQITYLPRRISNTELQTRTA